MQHSVLQLSLMGQSLRSFSASGPPDVRCCSNSVTNVAMQRNVALCQKRYMETQGTDMNEAANRDGLRPSRVKRRLDLPI